MGTASGDPTIVEIVNVPFGGSKVSTLSEHSLAPTVEVVTEMGPDPTTTPWAASSVGLEFLMAFGVTAPGATRFIIVEKEWVPDRLWDTNASFFGGVSAGYADATVAGVGTVIYECSDSGVGGD